MALRALLVSEDDHSSATLVSVLSGYGVAAQRCGYPNGVFYLPEQHLDALIVDFDDPQQAISVIQTGGSSASSAAPVIIALLREKEMVRSIFAAGANFVLYKPVSEDQAQATLRAAISLISRERRRSVRVPLQVPVQLFLKDNSEREGILLDLSEDGMDVLTSQPIPISSTIRVRFSLPGDRPMEVTAAIAWTNPNGQSGMRFVELEDGLRDKFRQWVASHASALPPDDRWISSCRLSDLSPNACYVQTKSPYPERSVVGLTVRVNGAAVNAEGMVKVMHPGIGMGIEFASRTAAQRGEVQNLLELLTCNPGAVPELQIMPRALNAGVEYNNQTQSPELVDDPLLQLLWNHESLNEEQFLHELQHQRSNEVSA
jgi:DNA-binding NarL/FixJ family response regulator